MGSHAISRVSGKSNFHLQKRKTASTGGGATKRRYTWSTKAIRRNRTGTGRMRSLRHVNKRKRTVIEPEPKPPRKSSPHELLAASIDAKGTTSDLTMKYLRTTCFMRT